MRKRTTQLLSSVGCCVLFVLAPLCALADGASTNGSEPQVQITEFQTGSPSSGKDEFIELYNNGQIPVDITGWQIRYISATSASASLSSPTQTITIVPSSSSVNVSMPARSYFVLHTTALLVPASVPAQAYAYTLPASGGNIALFAPNPATCQFAEQDAVAWGAGALGLGVSISASSKDADYQRLMSANGQYESTGDNATDFGITATATPGASNATLANATSARAVSTPALVSLPNTACTPPASGATTTDNNQAASDASAADTSKAGDSPSGSSPAASEPPVSSGDVSEVAAPDDMSSSDTDSSSVGSALPTADVGLASPQITELLPNPAAPQADANDEFVEVYNPNVTPFDLSGFTLISGTTTLHHFAFAGGTVLAPESFVAFFSADTGLSLSNDGGQVALINPNSVVVSQTSQYGVAPDGQSWALDNNTWTWTTTPTPNAVNIITALPASVPKVATASVKTTTKKSTPKKAASTKASSSVKTAKTIKAKAAAAKIPLAAGGNLSSVALPAPIHGSVLAFAALFAILYGAYEYRRDVANRLHQLRSYRSARRQARAGSAWRRGN